METPRQDPAGQYYEIQEIEEIPRIEASITGNPSKGVAENAIYLARSNPPSTGRVQRQILPDDDDDDGVEVILLLQEEEPARRRQVETTTSDARVIELSDSNSKLALRRQLEMTSAVEQQAAASSSRDESAEMLRKLPPDTIVTRHEEARKPSKVEDSDYKETNSSSGGSSSTSGCGAVKVKRIPRAVRNKTRETVEVRRNPMRVSKKDVDKDFPRPRQRLLANSRREICDNYEAGKRSTRSSATPYMNTRSVTRKMYTVGATYQAPTKRDETEWKKWPVHGMHERPVYHPQVGVAMEYLGRSFVSLDGLSYCEIVDESEIEVVAVDPRYDRRPSSAEKKSTGRAKTKNKRSSSNNTRDTWNASFSTKAANKSFGTCMHGSLHCVLGYCSQVMSYKPFCKQQEEKATTPAAKTSESTKENTAIFKDNIMENNSDKFALEGYAIAMAQSVQNKSNRDRAGGTVASSSQRSILENRRTNLPSLRNFPNASMVLLRNSGVKASGEAFHQAKDTKDTLKLDDHTSGEETLSSIYKKLMSADEVGAANREASPAGSSFYTLKRHSSSGAREYNAKRSALDAQLENTKRLRVAKESNDSGNVDNALRVQQPGRTSGMFSGSAGAKNRAWCTSETSEIARILSEYNRGTTRKSAIQIYGGASKGTKHSNLASSSTPKHSTKTSCFWQKDATTEENQNVSGDKNVGLDLSQKKWRKLSSLENQTQVVNNDRSALTRPGGLPAPYESYQSAASRDRQVYPSALSYTREKLAMAHKDLGKQRETLAIDTKPKKAASGCSKDEAEILKTQDSLRELLENTAVLYCAANGIHQDDLSSYIDTLDSKQSIQWLETLLQ